ncbi:YceI family protein [Urechidicola vernalis]|uniref:YceI family protein n=1 Tax=Urechidicola vernalis TaxID=3075600 RepID=A0ABU2Y5L2_9FLAO|nr:YceI family protein [Urechidicola sp. P050]MDT0553493.1 YceI family protein [Urechidicola sp. P050]
MKKVLPFIAVALLLVAFTPAKKTYKTVTEKSTLEWKGHKPTGEHFGTVQISEGMLQTNNGQIVTGNFTMDLKTIKVLDSESPRLEKHLKSADFFEVEAFPTANFVVSKSNVVDGKTKITGFLTIKGITKEINFMAQVSHNEAGQLVLESDSFKVNRADYNVKYKSKTFYANLADKFIYDEFEIKVKVVSSPE